MNRSGGLASASRWREVVLAVAVALLAALPVAAARAAFITVEPVAATAEVGDRLDLNLRVGFDADDELVSYFDFDLTFDSSVLGFDGLVFGTALGLLDDINSGAALSAPGTLDVFAFAEGLSDDELAALQPGSSVLLATLSFIGLSPGTSLVGVLGPTLDGFFLFGGRNFAALDLSGNSTARVTITAPPVPVPEPSTLTLFAAGLVSLGCITRRRRA